MTSALTHHARLVTRRIPNFGTLTRFECRPCGQTSLWSVSAGVAQRALELHRGRG